MTTMIEQEVSKLMMENERLYKKLVAHAELIAIAMRDLREIASGKIDDPITKANASIARLDAMWERSKR